MADAAVIVLAAVILVWVLFSAWLGRRSVTPSLTFVVAGLLVALWPGDAVQLQPSSETLRLLAEYALALLLFTDASRVSFAWLRSRAGLPIRLLLVGLPLTIAFGVAAAVALPLNAGIWIAAVIGAILAPTDAALSATILTDNRVPSTIRSVLNVESGLNDGLATPFVLFFISAAVASTDQQSISAAVIDALSELLIGLAIGAAVGGLGGWLLVVTGRRGWLDPAASPLGVLALAVLSYVVAIECSGNGFVASFVAGIAFGNVLRRGQSQEIELAEGLGGLLAYAVWFAFGAVLISVVWQHLTIWVVVYALVSLTVVRMVPVAVALLGAGLAAKDVAVIGWFGPRGMASIVFALLAYDTLGPGTSSTLVLAVVGCTVLLSVISHGLLAGPIAATYPPTTTSTGDGAHATAPPRSPHLLAWPRHRPDPR